MVERNKLLRDLNWCVHSAPLIKLDGQDCWPDQLWFEKWPWEYDSPKIEPETYKLGLRFESMMASWVKQESHLHLLARNLVVHDGQKTIGEFDLIVNNQGAVEHWELAVKFYLGIDDRLTMDKWFGPNPVDTLHKKVSRMTSHQLQLSHHPATIELLKQRDWEISAVRSIVKGRLFHPYKSFQQQIFELPEDVNPEHEKGWWLTVAEFEQQHELFNASFTQLEKTDWLAPLGRDDHRARLNHADMAEHLATIQTSGTVHIAVVNADGQETSRGFVVYPRWLEDVASENAHSSQHSPFSDLNPNG